MDSLFGIPMGSIMIALVALFAVSMVSVGFIAVTNRTMFKMGLRNIPRRGLQTGLVVVGLMLATLIITAAFTTGDTIDYSISSQAYNNWQRIDLSLNFHGEDDAGSAADAIYVSETAVPGLEAEFADDEQIAGWVPLLIEPVPAKNPRTGQSEPSLNLVGADAERVDALGGLRNVDGGRFEVATLGTNDVALSESSADDLDASVGDEISLYTNGVDFRVTVAAIVEDEVANGVEGMTMLLSSAQFVTAHPDEVNFIGVALEGDVRSTVALADSAAATIQAFLDSTDGAAVLGLDGRYVQVETVKADDVEEAESTGNLFTTFFLILGLFSIAAGVMLIFMIFVMLAAERKPEMGMARAVGAQRGNLVQSFIAEGMTYNLLAGALGAALGVAAALALVVGFMRYSLGSDFDFITAHVTTRSLVISYCLGVVLTFVTVVIASMKVSGVNIVAAIRGTPEDETPPPRQKISWRAVLVSIPLMIVPPVGLWVLLRSGLHISWTWILAPAGIVLSLLLIMAANGNSSEAMFSLGFSILPLCFAAIATKLHAPARLTWTLVGVYMLAYWMSPVSIGEQILGKEMKSDIEMFPISGVMIVLGFTLVIVFNARLLTLLFQRNGGFRYRVPVISAAVTVALAAAGFALGDAADGLGQLFYLGAALTGLVAVISWAAVRFPGLAPALKMGIAYPLSNRFRTGMTIAMFSLIIFSLTVFSAVNANFEQVFNGEDGDGGWDVMTTANRNTTVREIQVALIEAGAPVANDVTGSGSTTLFTGEQQVSVDGTEFNTYPVLAANDAFFSADNNKLNSWANGYESADEVFEAVRTDPTLALIDTNALEGGFNDFDDFSTGIDPEDDRFEATELTVTNPVTGATSTVTVIGVWASTLWGEDISGVYVNEAAYIPLFGEPEYLRSYLTVDGISAQTAARQVEAELSSQGVQADSIKKVLDDNSAQDRAFTRMFQGFMALGLFVGIAALGVIAFRSVVERRQQIGMLRAIGYQANTVAVTFVFESTFVAAMGIISGVVGGVIVSRNLFTTGQFSSEDVDFTIPWMELLMFVGVALVVSLFMTYWPSRSAAGVPVADALRYE